MRGGAAGPCGAALLELRSETGMALAATGERWLGLPSLEEERLLDMAQGPVLDVGCGPGRHVLALARRGIPAMGVDITPAAVGIARSRGAMVLRRSVFEHVPGHGRWRTVLLLDGNVGIGGDPALLLTRMRALLAPGGRILAEAGAEVDAEGYPHTEAIPTPPARDGGALLLARLEHGGPPGPWFGWANVDMAELAAAAARAGLVVEGAWSDGDRSFASIIRP